MGTERVRHGRVQPWVVGRRVVLRYRVGEADGRPLYSDVLGELVGVDDPVRIRRENGEVVEVRRADVYRLSGIPPRPERRADPLELDEIAAAGWQAPDSEWLGRWWLRAAEGWTQRANSVLPLGDPGLPVEEAVRRARQWYAERGLPLRFQLALPGSTELDAELDQAGLEAVSATLMQTASISAFAGEPPVTVELADAPSDGWRAGYRSRGASLPAVAVSVLTNAARPVFASIVEDGVHVAIARAVVDSGWLGITAVEVAESHRRRGLAGAVMRALATWGARNGARQAYLQVTADNTPALAFYERLGFTTHHRYHYRIEPATLRNSSA
ncbi:MAG TPA: GNAT family N-acetyltransferase [Mycobacteriales bacterium]|jgi:GNAT superfamily N-acetyltransferase|nr:GNAT family N-acetyltransferase [Mycobacteriales bacterium]